MDPAHTHCSSCFSVKCERSPSGCPVEICPNECGTHLHRCKFDEHTRHTCGAALVPCLNATNGCEEILPRAKLSQHLQHCPASVMMCRFSCDKEDEVPREWLGEKVIVTSGDRRKIKKRYYYVQRYFRFPCSTIVRRDEFARGNKGGVHVRRHVVDGCPMLAYGDKVPVQLKQPRKGDGDENCDILSHLPFEILMKICQYLDSLDLWSLSQVNHHIRQVCFNLAKTRGIVYFVWQKKEGTRKWEQSRKCWSFSKVFQEVLLWSHASTSAMGSHLMSHDQSHSQAQMYDHTIAPPWELPDKTTPPIDLSEVMYGIEDRLSGNPWPGY